MWTQDISQLDIDVSNHMYDWLLKPISVTAELKARCQELTVEVISQKFDEHGNLIRQVHLQGDGVAWSYGRVEVPRVTYERFKNEFDTLGNRSIGEVILHSNPNTKRGPFEYALIDVNCNLFNQATYNLPEKIKQQLWGRRSIFSIDGFELSVIEIFLPQIPTYKSAPARLRYAKL